MKLRSKNKNVYNIIYSLVYLIYKIGHSLTDNLSLILKYISKFKKSLQHLPRGIKLSLLLTAFINLVTYLGSTVFYFLNLASEYSKSLIKWILSVLKAWNYITSFFSKMLQAIVHLLKHAANAVFQSFKIVRSHSLMFILSIKSFTTQTQENFITTISTSKKTLINTCVNIRKKITTSNKRITNPFNYFRKVIRLKYWMLTGIVLILLVFTFTFIKFLETVPNPKSLNDFSTSSSNQIFDKNNTLLFNSYNKRNRIPVSLSNVSPILVKATIYSEDGRFYWHFGVDPIAITRSIFHNLSHKSIQGGSTITQQLAKNVFLTPEKSLKRKLSEAVLAFRIERNFSKNQILELYINAVSYGGDTVGIEAASQRYFGKKAKYLTTKEAIYLASITSAPSIYGPTSTDLTSYKLKEHQVLQKMVVNNDISNTEKDKIEHEKLVFAQPVIYKRAPHAVDYALEEMPKYISDVKGTSTGFLVKTTIDLPLQNYIQQNILSYIARERANNITNAGVIVINPHDGSIRAMVGSANYFDEGSGQYNTVLAKRQLGSAVKLITYARALETTYTPSSVIIDTPTTFTEFPGYNPRNYDGKFHGAVSLQSAFANSYNIPALKLAYSLGLRNVADQGVAMGISEFEFKDNNIPLSFVIGGVEIPLVHLAGAYSVVANSGQSVDVHIIDSIYDYENNLIYKVKSEQKKQVISPQTASTIFKILADKIARLPAFGYSSDFDFGDNQVAIKTGTSNDNKDNVAMAFTKDFVIGVWVGNNNGESMNNISSGYVGATSIMHTVATKMLDNIAKSNENNSIYALDNK